MDSNKLDSKNQNKAILEAFVEEVMETSRAWRIWSELFCHSEERIELLKHTAPAFFTNLGDLLLDRGLIGIARIHDPPVQRSNRNLAINVAEQLLIIPANTRKLRCWHASKRRLEGILPRIQRHRDKRIAHNDLETMVSGTLSKFSRQEIRKMACALNWLHSIAAEFGLNGLLDDSNLVGVSDLIHWLRSGEKYWELAKNGTIKPTPESLP